MAASFAALFAAFVAFVFAAFAVFFTAASAFFASVSAFLSSLAFWAICADVGDEADAGVDFASLFALTLSSYISLLTLRCSFLKSYVSVANFLAAFNSLFRLKINLP